MSFDIRVSVLIFVVRARCEAIGPGDPLLFIYVMTTFPSQLKQLGPHVDIDLHFHHAHYP